MENNNQVEVKPEQLRKGNILVNNADGELIIVKAYDIYCLEEGMDSFIMQPIPLTEEWLLKFGFEKTTWNGYNENKYFRQNFKYYGWIKDNIWCFISLRSLDENKENKPHFFGRRVLSPIYEDTWRFEEREGFLTYVHQLQNLYYALTGKELEINK